MKLLKRSSAYYRKHFFKYLSRLILRLAPTHKPACMIIGVQKAATTSLFNYLDKLPDFRGSLNKEVDFFSIEMNFNKSLTWYHSFFRSFSSRPDTVYFEGSPNYIYFPWVAQRIHEYNPSMKLIVVLREPIARAYSAWKMYEGFFRRQEFYRVAQGIQPGEENFINTFYFKGRNSFPSFEECVDIELGQLAKGTNVWEPSLLRRGLYATQLKRYLEYFKPEQLLVIGFKDLTENPNEELRKIYFFITGKAKPESLASLLKRNAIERGIRFQDSVWKKLQEFYAEPNAELEELLGRKLNW